MPTDVMRLPEEHPPAGEIPPPPLPETIEATGLDFAFMADLALKIVASDADSTTERVAKRIKLARPITEQLLQHLFRERLIEIRGAVGFHDHRYAMLDRGWERVYRLSETSGYVGPAPVSLADYTELTQAQARRRPAITPQQVHAALSELVLPAGAVQTLGLALSSGRSLLMMGPAGNGKTTIAKALHSAQAGSIWIPHAIEVDGQIIKVFDPHNHQLVDPAPTLPRGASYDERWVRIKRPLVIVGGELTIEAMDLTYSPTVRFYEAPFQFKANGGTLVIDDFGRQRVDPSDLINRWIIPIEGRVDYLTLHTGKKIEVPFENFLIFATNLEPDRIVDGAFLRRMGYRLLVEPPDRSAYGEIFQRVIQARGLRHDPAMLDAVFGLYERDQRSMAACEPRDLVDRCADICRLEKRPLAVTPDLLELAWERYFGARPR